MLFCAPGFDFGPQFGRQVGHGHQQLVAFGQFALAGHEDQLGQAAFDIGQLLAAAERS
jgi:hypothetical protein